MPVPANCILLKAKNSNSDGLGRQFVLTTNASLFHAENVSHKILINH
jgi:hypothetical protein